MIFSRRWLAVIRRAHRHGISQAEVLRTIRVGFDRHPERGNPAERADAWARVEATVADIYSKPSRPISIWKEPR